MKMVLSIDTNAKTVKGVKYGYTTGILYLAPADLSGKNVCPMAEAAGCKQACLNMAGRGVFQNVQDARIAKTKRFFEDYDNFMNDIASSIHRVIKRAEKLGTTPVIRLNGTSDIMWENMPFTLRGKLYMNMMELFPNVQFYDYTKIPVRSTPANYDLTFSYSGKDSYQRAVKMAADRGMRTAVVFRDRNKIPAEFLGMPVLDGDDSDLRFLEPQGTVVALYAKGPAKKDYSGFVQG